MYESAVEGTSVIGEHVLRKIRSDLPFFVLPALAYSERKRPNADRFFRQIEKPIPSTKGESLLRAPRSTLSDANAWTASSRSMSGTCN